MEQKGFAELYIHSGTEEQYRHMNRGRCGEMQQVPSVSKITAQNMEAVVFFLATDNISYTM